MDKIKVIIADDVEVIANRNKQIAELFDEIEVVGIAHNGEEELEMILELNPDLVITDNQMPLKNGINVVEDIYNMNLENKPKFIVVTGDAGGTFDKKAYELGGFKVISKIQIDSMLKYTIEEYLDTKFKKD